MTPPTYIFEHVQNIAKGMIKRYGNQSIALLECQRNIDSPLTTDTGKKFWRRVREEIENVVESPALKYRSSK